MKKEKLLPIHPGEILREELLKTYHISIEKLAESTKIKEERIKIWLKKNKISTPISLTDWVSTSIQEKTTDSIFKNIMN